MHYVNIGLVTVGLNGTPVDKNDPSTTFNDVLSSSTEPRVLPDPNIPNSAGYPTIKQYLEDEAGDDYVLKYMDQYIIITYLEASGE